MLSNRYHRIREADKNIFWEPPLPLMPFLEGEKAEKLRNCAARLMHFPKQVEAISYAVRIIPIGKTRAAPQKPIRETAGYATRFEAIGTAAAEFRDELMHRREEAGDLEKGLLGERVFPNLEVIISESAAMVRDLKALGGKESAPGGPQVAGKRETGFYRH